MDNKSAVVIDEKYIIKIADGLWQETINVSSYMTLLLYFHEAEMSDFIEDCKLAPAFHNTVTQALYFSMFMEIAKLYDKQGGHKSITIGDLLACCKSNIKIFTASKQYSVIQGMSAFSHTPIVYSVRFSDWSCLFNEFGSKMSVPKVSGDHRTDVELYFNDSPDKYDISIKISVSLIELFRIFELRLSSLGGSIKNLYIQRSSVYAHNDSVTCFDFENVFKAHPLLWVDMARLLDLAYDLCDCVLSLLTGYAKQRRYDNIDDIRQIFRLLRRGRKYSALKCAALLFEADHIDMPCDDALKTEIRKAYDLRNEWLEEIKLPTFSESTYEAVLMKYFPFLDTSSDAGVG